MATKIEWCEESWNPVTGCTPVSEGCANCYAANIAKRFWGDRKFSDVRFHRKRLYQPERWKKPRRIFICSMSDLFHRDIKTRDINSVFIQMVNNDRHTYIILTKRPERMKEFISIGTGWRGMMKNVWLGVTCENQKTADERIPILLDIPAVVRFVSCEPLLSYIDLMPWRNDISWCIVGTESGPKRRPARTDWIKYLKDQCAESKIPFFLKQMEIDGNVVKMPELDGTIYNQYPRS